MIPVRSLGALRYSDALALQEREHARIVREASPGEGVLLLLEHPPVVTMGRRYLPGDMILAESDLALRGIDYHHIDRGGSVTVHEPGQAVIYPIVKLDALRFGVRQFVTCLEDAMIAVCAEHGVEAVRDDANPGVWVNNDKVGAVGIRVKDRVTMHGLAFNVTNDLATFAAIVPCGLRGRGVTSLARLTGRPQSASGIGAHLAALISGRILRAFQD